MSDFRKELYDLCRREAKPSREAVAQVLAGVGKLELLSFLNDTAADLLAMVEDIPNLILDGLEEDLASDTRSKQAAADIIARLAAPRGTQGASMTTDPTNRQVEPFASFAEGAPLPKLSEAQRRVMKWLGKKWETAPGAGASILVNGKRICNVDTMHALARLGLVEQIEMDGRTAVGRWRGTPAGRALTQQLGL